MAVVNTGVLQLPDEDQKWLNSWLWEFDQAKGELASWASRLPLASPVRRPALIEMVKIDLERQWQRGRPVRLESYLAHYPELGTLDTVPPDLIQAEYEVRKQFGDRVDLVELEQRFPRQVDQLRHLIGEPCATISTPRPAQGQVDTVHPRPALNVGGAEAVPAELSGPFGHRYQILRLLGKGGMGAVYLAHDTILKREVALKVPQFTPQDGPELLKRFYREARTAATINHPNICPVYDVGEVDGIHYLTMAYVEGKPLAAFIVPDKPLPQRRVAAVVRKLALAFRRRTAGASSTAT
jgi:hypothetical protein